MEPLFTVNSQLSRDDYSDLIKNYLKKTLPLNIFGWAILIAFGVFNLRSGTQPSRGFGAAGMFWMAAVYFAVYCFRWFRYYKTMSSHIKNAGRNARYEFFAENITVSDGLGTRQIMNSEITAVAETERAIYAFFGDGEYIAVFKSLTPKELHMHLLCIRDRIHKEVNKAKDREIATRIFIPLILTLLIVLIISFKF